MVDSIAGEHMSGRSSTYGDGGQESAVGARSETSSVGLPGHYLQVSCASLDDIGRERDTAGRGTDHDCCQISYRCRSADC